MSDPIRTEADRAAAAAMLSRLRDAADVRQRKIRRTRARIRVGVYENDLKLAIAIERLIHGSP